jgi:hypothetical protein
MRRLLTTVILVPLLFSCDSKNSAPTETDASFDESRRAENIGEGNRFKLIGNAEITRDPENPTNIVLKVVSSGAPFPAAGVERDLKRVQLWQLDHQLNFKWAFVAPHTCGGGSPRIQLAIDSDGDGDRDFTAHGHIRPPHNACETSTPVPNEGGPAPSALLWRFDDLTDELGRWEITPGSIMTNPPISLPAFPYAQWDVFEQVVSAAFPNHRVLNARFLEDFNPTPGTAYYDLITVFDLTLGTEGQWQPERRGQDDR